MKKIMTHPKKIVNIFSLFSIYSLFLYLLGDHEMVLSQTRTTVDEFHVGVVFDMDRLVAKIGLTSMSMALFDFYNSSSITSHKRRLVLHLRDSNRDNVDAASAAIDLIKDDEVQAIIGPITSSQAVFMVDLGNKVHVPIISFTATSPSISPSENPYFIRTAQDDSSQVNPIAAIIKAFGWREVVLIYEDSEYGNGIIPYFVEAFQGIDRRVPYLSRIPTSATDDKILKELYKLTTMQTKVFIIHMRQSLGLRVFQSAKAIGMMKEGHSWIITDGLANFLNSFNSSVIDSMQGVLGIKPYTPNDKRLDKFRVRWKKKFIEENPDDIEKADLNVFGLWAYDTIWALASAVEKLETSTNSRFFRPKVADNSSVIQKLGISQVGLDLLKEISKTRFDGLSGEFHLTNGQLQSRSFQILNVIGRGEREIGFWTQLGGLSKDVHSVDNSTSVRSTYKDNLKSIIWPGDTTIVPKGWDILKNGKRLKIGVPVKEGFREFVNVTFGPRNVLNITGYCIDVFLQVVKKLPYPDLPYDLYPYMEPGENHTKSYNELINQVVVENFDAVVGDVTIIASRSLLVDFTLPYTESGVSMIVPLKDSVRKQGWIFLKPLKTELWLSTGAFFLFIGSVIWALEHQINDEFRGPPRYQLGTVLWFSFSMLVFAHREKLVSNYSRFVVTVWVFVVLILTSSYTANLASMLTVPQLEPTVSNVQELIKNENIVGYQEGSFVGNLLEGMGFRPSNLRSYKSTEEFQDAFVTKNDSARIVAAFDEIPFINLLMATYCGKYIMVGPINKTDGFGFAYKNASLEIVKGLLVDPFVRQVFPRDSPLVQDFSRAILNVTEGDVMTKIENKWLVGNQKCQDPNKTMESSNSLGLDSFWGLFLIAGLSTTLALLMFSVTFLYKHRNILTTDDTSMKKIIELSKRFDQIDLNSRTFRKYGQRQDGDNIENTTPKGTDEVPTILRSSSVSQPSIAYQTEGNILHPSEDHLMPDEGVRNSNSAEITIIEEEASVEQTIHQSSKQNITTSSDG